MDQIKLDLDQSNQIFQKDPKVLLFLLFKIKVCKL